MTTVIQDKTLKILPVNNLEMGEHNFYVITPEGDYMYFYNKKDANQFIDFYKTYTKKYPERK